MSQTKLRFRIVPLLASSLASLFFVGPLAAQQVASDSIPRNFAFALFQALGIEPTFSIAVDKPIAGFPADIIPRNATVLGGLISQNRITTILKMALPFGEATQAVRTMLLGGGWRVADTSEPPRQPNPGFAREAPAPQGGRGMSGFTPEPNSFCRNDEGVNISGSPAGAGTTRVMLHYTPVDRRFCNRTPPVLPQRTSNAYELMPELVPPPGAQPEIPTIAFGGSEYNTGIVLATTQTVAEVTRHYSTQLVTAGWTRVDSTAGAGMAAYQFTKTIASGAESWTALLTCVTMPNGGRLQVHLRMNKQ